MDSIFMGSFRGLAAVPTIRVHFCPSSKNVTAGQDDTCGDVNKASSGAIKIPDRWLPERAHKCLRTQYDDVARLALASCNSCS